MISQIIKLLSLFTNQRIVFPFYHAVTDEAPVHLKHLYKIRSVKQFEQDLDALLKVYKPISLSDLVDNIQGNSPLPRYAFHISFDDGLREFAQEAWPVLKRKGIPASLFVNPSFVDNKDLFYRIKASILIDFILKNQNTKLIKEAEDIFGSIIHSISDISSFIARVSYNQKSVLDDIASYFNIDFIRFKNERKPYLSTQELLNLQQEGVEIGAHSMDHPLFNQIPINTQKQQVIDSINWVEKNLNSKVKAFSFPFTDFGVTGELFSELYQTNSPVLDVSFGTAGLKKERYKQHMQRIPVEDSTKSITNQLLRQYLYFLAKAPLFKNTIRR